MLMTKALKENTLLPIAVLELIALCGASHHQILWQAQLAQHHAQIHDSPSPSHTCMQHWSVVTLSCDTVVLVSLCRQPLPTCPTCLMLTLVQYMLIRWCSPTRPDSSVTDRQAVNSTYALQAGTALMHTSQAARCTASQEGMSPLQ